MSKFTRGPWKANGRWVSGGPTDRNICNATEMTAVSLIKQSAEYDAAVANAKLIAAAPAMYEALRGIDLYFKMKGESHPAWGACIDALILADHG